MSTMLHDDARRLRALLDQTTPGRWHLKRHAEGDVFVEPHGHRSEAPVTMTLIGATDGDAAFVAHARSDAAFVIDLFRQGASVPGDHRARLEEILDRCAAAAPPPWTSFVEGRDHVSGSDMIARDTGDDDHDDLEIVGASAADLDFIATARHDLVQVARRLCYIPRPLRSLDG
ncbi:MAG: hypothetical protein QM820_58035 [Minicystis sp.]